VRAVLASVLVVALLAIGAPPADASQADLDRAQARANRAARELDAAQTRQAELEQQIAALEGQVAKTVQELAGLQGVVKERAVQQYIHGTGGDDLVIGTDLAASTRKNTLARFVSLGDDDAIDEYKRVNEDLAVVRGRLDEAKAQQASLLDQMQQRVNVAFAELRKLEKLEKERKARDAARAAAARSGRSSGSASARRGPSFIAGNGSWMCPVQGPHAFSNDYGNARSGGRSHQGNDILSPRGTPVVANVGGSVKRHDSGLGGISYYLQGDDGNEYYGAHLDSYVGGTGHVAQGTVIGYVGNTGNARGGPTHLHFEIHPGGGRAVNPYPTLRQYC
jgi:murein DD-endopeptidase MepM/ murein hydrolase activator NlpD